jgi:hypothetical protein
MVIGPDGFKYKVARGGKLTRGDQGDPRLPEVAGGARNDQNELLTPY